MGRRRNSEPAGWGPIGVAVAALSFALALAVPAVAMGAVGSAGIGDPLFPSAGNGGYDVQRYDLAIDYRPGLRPPGNLLRGDAKIDATATEALDRFDLDLRRPMRVSSVRVDGVPAQFTQSSQELVVTPGSPIASGAGFQIDVRYAGHPAPVFDPDGSVEGWLAGSRDTLSPGEPQGGPSWFPCNDHPSDKAVFQISVTVPARLKAISNGLLVSDTRSGGSRTFVWQSQQPMATYLATVAIGPFQLVHSVVDGLPAWSAWNPAEARAGRADLRRLGGVLRFYSSLYGPYPFTSTGFVIAIPGQGLGYLALENQTRPTYFAVPGTAVFVHELAHEWFGDAVSPASWSDIWLNEGFASFSEWLWSEHSGRASAASIFRFFYRHFGPRAPVWSPPPGRPGKAKLVFANSIYLRGAMTLEALRMKIGDAAFFATLRDWVAQHLYGNGSVPQFIALAEQESGQDLTHFFDVWLYRHGRPVSW